MVKAHFVIPAGVTVEYQEGGAGNWIPLVDVYGPSTGFPLGDITSTFRGTFTEAGTKTVTVNFTEVGTNNVLGSKNITTTVVAAPVITVALYSTVPTNQDITVTATTDKGTLNADSHLFTENDSYTFIATDAAGNSASQTVIITNIDKANPIITIAPYNTAQTNADITVNASTNEGTLNYTSHIFAANSSFDFVATDEAGNVTTQTVTISNIVDTDQTVPDTNGNVIISSSTPEVVITNPTQ